MEQFWYLLVILFNDTWTFTNYYYYLNNCHSRRIACTRDMNEIIWLNGMYLTVWHSHNLDLKYTALSDIDQWHNHIISQRANTQRLKENVRTDSVRFSFFFFLNSLLDYVSNTDCAIHMSIKRFKITRSISEMMTFAYFNMYCTRFSICEVNYFRAILFLFFSIEKMKKKKINHTAWLTYSVYRCVCNKVHILKCPLKSKCIVKIDDCRKWKPNYSRYPLLS